MNTWQLFPMVAPDLNNNRRSRWYWRNVTNDYVATSVAGFESVEECRRNAREHGMPTDEGTVLDHAPDRRR